MMQTGNGIGFNNDVFNQKGTPALYSAILAEIPTPGYIGRLFFATDTFQIFRDNGVSWDNFSVGGGTITTGLNGLINLSASALGLGGSLSQNTGISGNYKLSLTQANFGVGAIATATHKTYFLNNIAGNIPDGSAALLAQNFILPDSTQTNKNFYGGATLLDIDMSAGAINATDTTNVSGGVSVLDLSNTTGVSSTAKFSAHRSAIFLNNALDIDFLSCYYAGKPSVVGSGVKNIARFAGMYIDDLAGVGTETFGIYQNGIQPNFIQGKIYNNAELSFKANSYRFENNSDFLETIDNAGVYLLKTKAISFTNGTSRVARFDLSGVFDNPSVLIGDIDNNSSGAAIGVNINENAIIMSCYNSNPGVVTPDGTFIRIIINGVLKYLQVFDF